MGPSGASQVQNGPGLGDGCQCWDPMRWIILSVSLRRRSACVMTFAGFSYTAGFVLPFHLHQCFIIAARES